MCRFPPPLRFCFVLSFSILRALAPPTLPSLSHLPCAANTSSLPPHWDDPSPPAASHVLLLSDHYGPWPWPWPRLYVTVHSGSWPCPPHYHSLCRLRNLASARLKLFHPIWVYYSIYLSNCITLDPLIRRHTHSNTNPMTLPFPLTTYLISLISYPSCGYYSPPFTDSLSSHAFTIHN